MNGAETVETDKTVEQVNVTEEEKQVSSCIKPKPL